MSKVQIRPEQVDTIRSWFKGGKGVYRWTNKEIGVSRGDRLTEGEGKAPHWAFVGEPSEVKIEDVEVLTETLIRDPPQWHPVCEKCNGAGRRSVAELAVIRKESVEETLERLVDPWKATLSEDKSTFACNYCQSTGHIVERFKCRPSRKYWGGLELKDSAVGKVKRHIKRLAAHYSIEKEIEYDFDYFESGIATLKFYTTEVKPFTLE